MPRGVHGALGLAHGALQHAADAKSRRAAAGIASACAAATRGRCLTYRDVRAAAAEHQPVWLVHHERRPVGGRVVKRRLREWEGRRKLRNNPYEGPTKGGHKHVLK